MTSTCYLFDVYSQEDLMYLWVIDGEKRLSLYTDVYHPVIYADGPTGLLHKFVDRLYQLDALFHEPRWVTRRHFYQNKKVKVLELVISRPSVLWKIKSKLFAMIRRLDVYHSDIEPVISYMYRRRLYPLAPVKVESRVASRSNRVVNITALKPVTDFEYDIPPLRVLELSLKGSHRLGYCGQNPLQLKAYQLPHLRVADLKNYDKLDLQPVLYDVPFSGEQNSLHHLNRILRIENPDVIISSFGDQVIMPTLFSWAQKHKIVLELDRDLVPPTARRIIKRGKSFNTYGSWVFRAPSYPLFGRWHIDSRNSFTYKETQLFGIIELARLSRMPVQRLARASTGGALTNMEMAVAIEQDYLVPWQKSALEQEKSWYNLHLWDKGGLVFQPDIDRGNVKENVVQLDFSQMYPSIMHLHNISPETINCLCCENEKKVKLVPETGFRICQKRRGVVSDTLGHVLERRAYYKERKKVTTGFEQELNQAKIDSLKWVNVVSFGYLGYRNAKFGKIESHESVTAFGREKLIKAFRLAERRKYCLSHAITDCIFIHRPDHRKLNNVELDELCELIYKHTKIKMSIEGIFTWLLFLPSRQDSKMPVANKYLGRFDSGELKYRGIAVRRKDIPGFIKQAQYAQLEVMRQGVTFADVKKLHPEMHRLYLHYDNQVKSGQIPWRDLLLRKTVSKELADYQVQNATSLSMRELRQNHIHVQPGEKVRFLVLEQKHFRPEKRYISEELATLHYHKEMVPFDRGFYRELWWQSYKELWEHFAPPGYFKRAREKQQYLFD